MAAFDHHRYSTQLANLPSYRPSLHNKTTCRQQPHRRLVLPKPPRRECERVRDVFGGAGPWHATVASISPPIISRQELASGRNEIGPRWISRTVWKVPRQTEKNRVFYFTLRLQDGRPVKYTVVLLLQLSFSWVILLPASRSWTWADFYWGRILATTFPAAASRALKLAPYPYAILTA